MTIGTVTLIVIIMITGVIIGRRTRRELRSEETQIVQGIRKVCKLSTVELSLADYAKKTVPKTIDLPFTEEPTAYLFYSGVVSAGFDVCDGPSQVEVSHAKRQVLVRLPPPRILSVDVLRFETINEESGFLNAISPKDRNRWFTEARASLEKAANAAGALQKAQEHAHDLLASFVEPRGYTLQLLVADSRQ
jgi:hypothetical protein